MATGDIRYIGGIHHRIGEKPPIINQNGSNTHQIGVNTTMVERAGFEPAYGKPGQIYSLLPLTTRPPLQVVRPALWRGDRVLSTALPSRLPAPGEVVAATTIRRASSPQRSSPGSTISISRNGWRSARRPLRVRYANPLAHRCLPKGSLESTPESQVKLVHETKSDTPGLSHYRLGNGNGGCYAARQARGPPASRIDPLSARREDRLWQTNWMHPAAQATSLRHHSRASPTRSRPQASRQPLPVRTLVSAPSGRQSKMLQIYLIPSK